MKQRFALLMFSALVITSGAYAQKETKTERFASKTKGHLVGIHFTMSDFVAPLDFESFNSLRKIPWRDKSPGLSKSGLFYYYCTLKLYLMCKPSISRLPAAKVPVFSMCRVAVVNKHRIRFIDPKGAIANGMVPISQNCKVWGWICGAQMDLFNV